jgi:hypothetical protein
VINNVQCTSIVTRLCVFHSEWYSEWVIWFLCRPLPPLPNLEVSDGVEKAADHALVWIKKLLNVFIKVCLFLWESQFLTHFTVYLFLIMYALPFPCSPWCKGVALYLTQTLQHVTCAFLEGNSFSSVGLLLSYMKCISLVLLANASVGGKYEKNNLCQIYWSHILFFSMVFFTHAVESSMYKSFLAPYATEVQVFWDWWRQEGQGNICALIFDNLSCAQLLMW